MNTDAWGLILSIMGNLSLAVLLLVKERRRTPQDTPPVTCPQHAGMVSWIRELRDGMKASAQETRAALENLSRDIRELAVNLARLEGGRDE